MVRWLRWSRSRQLAVAGVLAISLAAAMVTGTSYPAGGALLAGQAKPDVQAAAGTSGQAADLAVQAGQARTRINPTQFGEFFEEVTHSGDGGLYAELVRNRSFKESDNTPYSVDDQVAGTGNDQWNYVGPDWIGGNGVTGHSYFGVGDGGSYSAEANPGNYATMTFTGTQVAYYAVTCSACGIADVSIDNGPVSQVDLYSANTAGGVLVWTSPVLPAGTHTLKIAATGTRNPASSGDTVTIDSAAVTGGPPPGWSLASSGGGTGSMNLDFSQPLNQASNRSLALHVTSVPPGGAVGVANSGYWGIPVRPGQRYQASFFAKATASFHGPLVVAVQGDNGTVYAQGQVPQLTTGWHRYTVHLVASGATAPSLTNQLVLAATSPLASGSTVWFDVVSLFPPAYHNRPNGNRIDLMHKLAALHPGFLRFPGGNYLEGETIGTRFNWKQTIGPIWDRPGHYDSAWDYWSDDGLGLLEYLEMAQDLHATPILGLWAGYTLNGTVVPQSQLQPYVQDALDEIQFATGPTTSTWGALRAKYGHPKPFDLKYAEIGNEDFFDGSGSYNAYRYPMFYDAIKAKYPQLQLVATAPVTSRPMDVLDEHFYNSPQWFTDNASMFDTASRSGPRILVSEYAALQGCPSGTNLADAVGESAFLAGMERNSDVVMGSSYAPLLINVHSLCLSWQVNSIGFNGLRSYGSPSYYAQQLFALNHGDVTVASTLTGAQPGITQVASLDETTGTLYVTVVNPTGTAQATSVHVGGAASVGPHGSATVLTGDPSAQNTLSDPTHVTPVTTPLTGLGTSFSYEFPASSVTVLRLSTQGVHPSPVSASAPRASTSTASLPGAAQMRKWATLANPHK